jgi:AcrR family transcriptional regulator
VATRENAGEDSGSRLARLPPGRHGLSREFVTRNQRDRLTAGMIAAVAENGYHGASITRIAAAAGISRRTFYTYFSSKEECFLDTYEQIADHIGASMEDAGAEEDDWPRCVRAELHAMLEAFAANPNLVWFCLIAPPNAGGEITAPYRDLLQRLYTILTAGRPTSPEIREPSKALAESLVGGIAILIVRQVKAGEGESLPDLVPDLLELFLTPFLGLAEAGRVARATP